jgi:hypothetical protein
MNNYGPGQNGQPGYQGPPSNMNNYGPGAQQWQQTQGQVGPHNINNYGPHAQQWQAIPGQIAPNNINNYGPGAPQWQGITTPGQVGPYANINNYGPQPQYLQQIPGQVGPAAVIQNWPGAEPPAPQGIPAGFVYVHGYGWYKPGIINGTPKGMKGFRLGSGHVAYFPMGMSPPSTPLPVVIAMGTLPEMEVPVSPIPLPDPPTPLPDEPAPENIPPGYVYVHGYGWYKPGIITKAPKGMKGFKLSTGHLAYFPVNMPPPTTPLPTLIITDDRLPEFDPEPILPNPVNPKPLSPDPVSPEPVTPEPETPKPITPKPVTPGTPDEPALDLLAPGGIQPHYIYVHNYGWYHPKWIVGVPRGMKGYRLPSGHILYYPISVTPTSPIPSPLADEGNLPEFEKEPDPPKQHPIDYVYVHGFGWYPPGKITGIPKSMRGYRLSTGHLAYFPVTVVHFPLSSDVVTDDRLPEFEPQPQGPQKFSKNHVYIYGFGWYPPGKITGVPKGMRGFILSSGHLAYFPVHVPYHPLEGDLVTDDRMPEFETEPSAPPEFGLDHVYVHGYGWYPPGVINEVPKGMRGFYLASGHLAYFPLNVPHSPLITTLVIDGRKPVFEVRGSSGLHELLMMKFKAHLNASKNPVAIGKPTNYGDLIKSMFARHMSSAPPPVNAGKSNDYSSLLKDMFKKHVQGNLPSNVSKKPQSAVDQGSLKDMFRNHVQSQGVAMPRTPSTSPQVENKYQDLKEMFSNHIKSLNLNFTTVNFDQGKLKLKADVLQNSPR